MGYDCEWSLSVIFFTFLNERSTLLLFSYSLGRYRADSFLGIFKASVLTNSSHLC